MPSAQEQQRFLHSRRADRGDWTRGFNTMIQQIVTWGNCIVYIYILKDNICIFMHHYINHHILLGAKLGDIVRYDYDLMTSLGVLYDEI
jgi:hypothetical protein